VAVSARHFQKLLDFHDRSAFLGPPDSARDVILMATKSLVQGDWLFAFNLIRSLPCWCSFSTEHRSRTLSLLKERTKATAVQSYVVVHSNAFRSLSLAYICENFQLSGQVVRSTIGNLVMNKLIYGLFDQTSGDIVLENKPKSALQALIIMAYDKAGILLDSCEKSYAISLMEGR
jgi:translation initiation factor 3 subunit C